MVGRPIVIVDAENVRRSRWPNVTKQDLVAGARAWAEAQDVRLLVVFDGPPPEEAGDLVGSGARSADDRIAELAAELSSRGEPYWLVTSDRELRARAGGAAERTIGGGSYLAELA
jgi:hypothetical protein